jgi:hypothetical protein
MPYTLNFDPDHDVVLGTGTGTLGYLEALEAAVSTWEHREWKGKSIVWDFRNAHFEMTGNSVREFADFVTKHQPLSRPPRVALVVGNEFNFGMARMFEAFREDLSTEVRVFHDYQDGVAWASQATGRRLDAERP